MTLPEAGVPGGAEIRERPLAYLEEYARIPIRFEVRSVLEVTPRDGGLGGLVFAERARIPPVLKDYDSIAGNHPRDWPRRFDLSNCGLLSAEREGRLAGGAMIVFRTPGVEMLEGRSDLAVLWDLRIAPDARRRGLGAALFVRAAEWARARGCRRLKVETQNVNVPACRFYASQGCVLGAVHRFAYPELPEEVQLLWYRDLA